MTKRKHKNKKGAGRPVSARTKAVMAVLKDYKGMDALKDVPAMVHKRYPKITVEEAYKRTWQLLRGGK